MRRIFVVLLISAVAFSISQSTLEETIKSYIQKDVSCSVGEILFNCIIDVNEQALFYCSDGNCYMRVMGKQRSMSDKGKVIVDNAFLACPLLERLGVEGCECTKNSEGVVCNIDKVKIDGSCGKDDRCNTNVLGTNREFTLRDRRMLKEFEDGHVEEIRNGYIRVTREGDVRKLHLYMGNFKGAMMTLEGTIMNDTDKAALRAGMKSELSKIRDRIRKMRKNAEVVQAIEISPENMRLSQAKIRFELPCSNYACDNEYEVWHLKDSGEEEKLNASVRREGETLIIEVEAKSFSIYALTTVGQLSTEKPKEIPLKPQSNTNNICLGGLLLIGAGAKLGIE
ncbi:MAG: hypothetical protein D6769_01690, partial [Methanobacteriota archaeon]